MVAKVVKEKVLEIEMPTSITIGDDMYFDEPNAKDLVYHKSYRGRSSWLGQMKVTKEVHRYKDIDGEIESVIVDVILAPDQTFLDLYIGNSRYTRQRQVETDIGVDSAGYIVEINKSRYIEIDTGSDGLMGSVTEMYTKGKLEGILISLTGLDMNSYEDFLSDMKYVWGAK